VAQKLKREQHQYNDEVEIYDHAAKLLQEAELLSKSHDFNDWVDAAETVCSAREMLEGIRTFDTTKLEMVCNELEDKLTIY
jgi:hypothetical protein